jgi:hypothetical protein
METVNKHHPNNQLEVDSVLPADPAAPSDAPSEANTGVGVSWQHLQKLVGDDATAGGVQVHVTTELSLSPTASLATVRSRK